MFIGLMGVSDDGILITPSGKDICKVPLWFAWKIQKIQHFIARLAWR